MIDGLPAYLGLGSNLGDRRATIHRAIRAIGEIEGVHVVAVSPVIETEPVGPIEQGEFLNAAAHVTTALSARRLLEVLNDLERSFGRDRDREERWGPRTLDVDVLLYADIVIDEPGLTIPHPSMHERRFVLEPLASIARDVVVPTLDRSVGELLEALRVGP